MVTAGVLHGIGGTEFIQGLKTPVTDPNLLTLAQKAQNALVDSLARSAVNTATDVIISGHDLDDALKSVLLSTVAGVIGQVAANEIGDFYKKAPLDGSIDPLEYGLHKVMHAALGCGTAAISGANCAAGAAGGVAGAVVSEAFYDPSDKVVELTKKVKSGEITNAEKIKLLIEFKREGADMARLAAAFTALAVGVKSGEDVNAAANAGQNVAENNALETVWDLASLSMSLVELGVAINDGDALDIALAGGSVIIDGLSVLVPGVPGGAGYLLKASKTADGKLVAKVVDEAGNSFKVVDSKLSLELPKGYSELKSVGSAGNSTGGLPNGYRRVVNDKTGDIEILGGDGKTYSSLDELPSTSTSHFSGQYEPNPKHDLPGGKISPQPTNPEKVLADSVPVKGNSNKRIGYDADTGQIVEFQNHQGNSYHGYQVSWKDLNQSSKNALIKAGLFKPNGKVVK